MTQAQFVSTRGGCPAVGYEQAILSGFAPDKGLWTPEQLPRVNAEWLKLIRGKQLDYRVLTMELSTLLDGDTIPSRDRHAIIESAFSPAVWGKDPAPIMRLDGSLNFMELFHGPSGAFKDLPMQPVAGEFKYLLGKKGNRMTVVVATSGDTGPAAIEAFNDFPNVDVVVFFPKNGTSRLQYSQIATATGKNICPIAIDGTFDDCQAIVKTLGTRPDLVRLLKLSGVNSINWGRIRSQITYYFHAWAKVARTDTDVVTFFVPAGNFGNALAGYYAQEMGLPIRIVIATNTNAMLVDFFDVGLYAPQSIVKTVSPSMDISEASNIERLLFRVVGNDASVVAAYMKDLVTNGHYQLRREHLARLRATGIRADWASEDECKKSMMEVFNKYDYIIDTHTAVAYAVYKRMKDSIDGPVVILSTAAPFKFGPAVREAIGGLPERPAKFVGIENLPTPRLVHLPANADVVEAYLREHLKAA